MRRLRVTASMDQKLDGLAARLVRPALGELRKRHRRWHRATSGLVAALLFWSWSVSAQEQQPAATEGINVGNYNIQQTFEFGGRFTDTTGSPSVYNTFVNLHTGPRLYEQTISMRSLNHQGLLLDNLYISSFGYGGDPNNATRLRAYKNKWYDFSANFRRDKNFWNYNLLANPLNPTTSNPSLILTDSLHAFNTVRRMTDVRLTLGPQSRVRLRLGYLRNISEGPSYSTARRGTETLVFQDWKTTTNAYQIGLDFQVLPRTSFSYDQFLNYYKGDTSWVDQNLGYVLSNGVPVDLGVIFNTAAGQPCSAPVSSAATTPPTANPGCNAFLSYSRAGPQRTSLPTEQFSFESSYFRNLNMAGRIIYSAADNDVLGFRELSNLNATRTRERSLDSSGVTGSRRVSTTVDWAATYMVTPKFRIVDEFRFNYFRIPAAFDFTLTSLFAQGPLLPGNTPSMLLPPAQFTSANCPAPYTALTCPQHSTSSGPDLAVGTDVRFLGQNTKYNTFRLEYDFTRRFGGRLGYRYGHRNISEFGATFYEREVYYPGVGAALARRGDCALESGALPAGCTAMPDGSVVFSGLKPGSDTEREEFPIDEHSALVGVWARPADTVRLSFDMELLYRDRSFTRISPRHLQHYKLRASYRPRGWINLGATLNILENSNAHAQVGNQQHNRNYGVSVALEPHDRFGFDLGYEYADILSLSNICFASSVATTSAPCPVSGGSPLLGISRYTNKTNFSYINLMWRPIRRLTATAGYTVNSVTGDAPILDTATGLPITLNPNSPAGSLQYNYHKPYAGLAAELGRGVTWKAGWSYYEYGEKAPPDPTGPRSFHANLLDLSLRYSF